MPTIVYDTCWTNCTYPVTNAELWGAWASSTAATSITVTTSYVTNVTWDNWVTFSNGRRRRVQSSEDLGGWVREPIQSPEEDARARQWQEERARQRAEAQQRRHDINARALELLRSCMNDEQRDQLVRLGRFSVAAPSGRVYWIETGYAGNVHSNGWTYCIHMRSDIPEGDQMLAQKLMIETDEEGFLRIANASPGRLAA
jgi:hypothetical protein